MRSFIIKLLFLVMFATFAHASKPSKIYFGGDFLMTDVKYDYFNNNSNSLTDPVEKSVSSNSMSGGVFVGYKSYARRYYVAPELFFDYLNNKTPDFYSGNGGVFLADYSPPNGPSRSAGDSTVGNYTSDEMIIDYRYGFKMNFGYRPTTRLDLFVNAGIASVHYMMRWVNDCPAGYTLCHKSYSVFETTPIAGAGLSYAIDENWAVRAAYDFQRIKVSYAAAQQLEGLVSQADIQNFRLGVSYQFNVWD